MWWRRSWFSLKGKAGIPGQTEGCPATPIALRAPPAGSLQQRAMRQLQRFFKSPSTVCVSAEGHLLAAEEPGNVREEWKSWRLDTLPIALESIPVTYGTSRSGQSHKPKVDAIKQALQGVERVIIATDPGREGSMIAWEVLEHLGYRGRVDRLKLGALDDVSIRRAFALLAEEPDSGERDYAAYLEAL